jgi:hypothetical protein
VPLYLSSFCYKQEISHIQQLNIGNRELRMSEDSKHGTPWTAVELDVIVADYFSMLVDDLVGRPYVKAHHSSAIMRQIGRTHRSVEFKHQNISAVMDELGMPWIPGYRPKPNYQNSIFDAIDRFLTGHPDLVQIAPTVRVEDNLSQNVFVEPPAKNLSSKPIPERLKNLIKKFDPVERDKRNHLLGRAGESFVVDLERARLLEGRRRDLANRVRWVADEDGDGAGFDVLSFTLAGAERLLEVKTTTGTARPPFFLSRNECAVALERPMDWRIYRVHLFGNGPRIFTIAPPIEATLKLTTEIWRASF